MRRRLFPVSFLLIAAAIFLTSCSGKEAAKETKETEVQQNTEETAAEKETEAPPAAGKEESAEKETESVSREPETKKEITNKPVEEKKPIIETLTVNTISDGIVLIDVSLPEGFEIIDRGNNYICLERAEDHRKVDYYVYDLGEADPDGLYFVEKYVPLVMSDYRKSGARLGCTAQQYEGSYFTYTLVMMDTQWDGGLKEGLVIGWAPTGIPGIFAICEVDDGYEDTDGKKNVDLTNAELESYINAAKLHDQ